MRSCQIFVLFFTGSMMLSPAASSQAQPAAALQNSTGQNSTGQNSTDQSLALPDTDEGLLGVGPIRRTDWFRGVWKKRRTAWLKRVEQDQQAIVFLGDSITQSWGDNFDGHFPEMKLANRGISGDTTRGMFIRLQQDVLSLNPRGVVMLMGTNDLKDEATPEVIAGNVKSIVDALKKHDPKMPIVLCLVMPSSSNKSRPVKKIKEINKQYAAVVQGDPQVTVVDTWTLFADEKGNARKKEFPDLLHPNQAGYAKWAAALRPIFATLGFLETEPDDFVMEPGFESLFNGRDLTGWGFHETPQKAKAQYAQRNVRPSGWVWPIVEKQIRFDGQSVTPGGRYAAINGRLVVTTPPEGRKFQQLWTTREFPSDFVLKMDFRATPNADSGVFIRKPQLQCRDYLLAGPYKTLKSYRPQDWNELVVSVKGRVAHCTCNGELLEAEFALPETGSIGLEGDRGQVEYRRIRIKLIED